MSKAVRKDTSLGLTFVYSLLLHAVLVGVIYLSNFLPCPLPPGEQACYVDLVNLPVARPEAGTPAVRDNGPAEPRPAPRQEMKLPPEPRSKPAEPVAEPQARKRTRETVPAESGKEFAERLARMEAEAEARHERAVIDAIRKRAASGGGRPGVPAGGGNQAGSDYASYIRSRLEDAFFTTIYQSRNPEMLVRIRLGPNGRVVGYRVERTTHDRLFEVAVRRAVDAASEHFPPTPDGREFEQEFVFRPGRVGKK